MTWKPYDPATLDLTGEQVFVETGTPIAGGRWHLLADGTVVYENPAGTWMPSTHSVEALATLPGSLPPVPTRSRSTLCLRSSPKPATRSATSTAR